MIEMDDREDGELSGSGDDTGMCTPAESVLPTANAAAPAMALFQYRNNSTTLSGPRGASATHSSGDDQSSDGDSDDENCHLKAAKRPKRIMTGLHLQQNAQPGISPEQHAVLLMEQQKQQQTTPVAATAAPQKNSKKRNNIWANVLGEQTLTEDIVSVGLKKLDGDRTVENYDFRAAQLAAMKARQEQEELEDGEMIEDEQGDEGEERAKEAETDEARAMMAKRLSRGRPMSSRVHRPMPPQPCGEPGEPVTLPHLCPEHSRTNQELADAIAVCLMEQKPQIIASIVEVLGREVAIKLYEDTKLLEQQGGMLIMNGDRRRTSGGVYLQLLKKQFTLTKEQQALIFPPDEAQQQWRRRRRAVTRRRNRERHETGGRDGAEGHQHSSGSPSQPRCPSGSLLLGRVGSPSVTDDSNDAHDVQQGTKCPGSTPVNSPTPSPSDLAATPTPGVTPQCSDGEDSRGGTEDTHTTHAVVKAMPPEMASHAQPNEEDFVDLSTPSTTAALPAADEMDVC